MFVYTRSTRLPQLTRLLCALALLASGLLLAHPQTAAAATFTVTKTSDSKDGACNSDCSLREAIIAAHQQAGVDTITLRAGTYRVTLSDLDITSSLTIVGASSATTIIESNGEDRVFEVRPGITVTIDKVTIRNGSMLGINTNGGGIFNNGELTLSNSIVSDNTIEGYGGGIYNTAKLQVINSTIRGNRSSEMSGGGLYNHEGTVTLINTTLTGNGAMTTGGIVNWGGTLTLTNSTVSNSTSGEGLGGGIFNNAILTLTQSTVSNNLTRYDGGGIYNSGTATITSSTITGNSTQDSATFGGGIYNEGTLTLTNSTISGNELSAFGAGGGIYNEGTATITSSTITANRASGGSGGLSSRSTASVTLSNTIIAGNSTQEGDGPDCGATLTSQGYNLIQNTTGCTITGDTTGNRTGVAAQLGALADNGGPTQTHLPASGSPAIDRGNPATPGSGGNACPATDQRGQARPKDGNADGIARCDIGAVER